MKVVLLAGGKGTRIAEETINKPKPLIEIGGLPLLVHIMNNYSLYGLKDFIICTGHKGHLINEYFINFKNLFSDIEINHQSNDIRILKENKFNFNIKIINTGRETGTGGRIKKIKKYILPDENFCLTYGDTLCNVNIEKLIKAHKKYKKLVTVTAIPLRSRFGIMNIKKNIVKNFTEKPIIKDNYINGGFFVLSNKIFKYIKNNSTMWEQSPLRNLTKNGQVSTYIHNGFWQPCDTVRDLNILKEIWEKNNSFSF